MNRFVNQLRRRLPRGGFTQNALIMMTGTTIAQSVSIAIAPILTRLYSPSDYGVFAVYSSLSTIISIIATGRYDSAVMLPEKDEDAANLAVLSVAVTASISLLCLITLLLFNQTIAVILGSADVAQWLYLIPLTTLMAGIYQSMYCWTSRRRAFKQLSIGKICGAFAGGTTNIGYPLLWKNVGGLIIGSVVNQGITTAILVSQVLNEHTVNRFRIRRSAVLTLACRYYKFPLYSLPSDFINTAAQQTPVLLLGNFFGSTVVGLYSLTQRVFSLPLNMIASSILDVFRQRASSDFNQFGTCREIFLKTFKALLSISLFPFVMFFFSAPWLFETIFGREWAISGEYAQILTPYFMLKFVVSPLTYVMYIAEKQHMDLMGNIALFVFASLSIIVGGVLHHVELGLMLFAGSYSLIYVLYFFLSYYYSIAR